MMMFFLVVLILVNIGVFFLGVNPTLVIFIVSGFVAVCKVFTTKKFSDVYNIHSFKRTLNSNNILELVGSFLIGLIACKNIHGFDIIDFFIFIVFSLLIYRFLFFNLSKKISNRKD